MLHPLLLGRGGPENLAATFAKNTGIIDAAIMLFNIVAVIRTHVCAFLMVVLTPCVKHTLVRDPNEPVCRLYCYSSCATLRGQSLEVKENKDTELVERVAKISLIGICRSAGIYMRIQ